MEGIIELTDGDGRRAWNELVFVFVDREASELGFYAEMCNGDCSSFHFVWCTADWKIFFSLESEKQLLVFSSRSRLIQHAYVFIISYHIYIL